MKLYEKVKYYADIYYGVNIVTISLAFVSFIIAILFCTTTHKLSVKKTETNADYLYNTSLKNFIKEFAINVENSSESKNESFAFYEEDCDQLGQCVKKIVLQRYCCKIDVNGTFNGDCCSSKTTYKKT